MSSEELIEPDNMRTTNSQNIADLTFLHKNTQEKYRYYLLALAATALGFAILKSFGLPLNLAKIPLFLALTFWGYSIYTGQKHLRLGMEITFLNIQLLKAREKSIKNDFNSTKNILNEETITNFLLGRNKEAVKTANWQEYHFYIGVLTFVIWDFMEMGLNHSC